MNRRERLAAYVIARIHRPFCRMERAISQSRLGAALHERASGLVHRADWIFIGLVLLSGVPAFLPGSVMVSSFGALFAFLVLGGLFFKMQHGARLCEQCVTEFEIDAPGHAARHQRRFRAFHSSGVLLVMLAPMIASLFLEAPWKGVAMLPSVGAQVAFTLLARFHGAYQPWCPYCHPRRGGGGGGTEPAPDPSGGRGRPLPVT
jgi:hypothetical protein